MTSRFSKLNDSKTQLITQGEHAASADPEMMIKTLLGSCVSCCLWDQEAGVGGMNHLLLAGKRIGNGSGYDVAGVAEMECLINAILKLGGRRDHLRAKVFGGAKMINTPNAIGDSNAKFAFDFLQQENIECVSSSVGGRSARAIRFWPASGRVNMRLTNTATEQAPAAPEPVAGNDLELF